ncbi:carbamate kinase [Avibacterium paragallinarum]|uniref:carbamate kinase n=1 Tax=Avibacterium paragallinarum TaxID=728 RepID=UPI00397AC2D7
MKPKIVIALGGNALLKRGQNISYKNQLDNIKIAARVIGKLAQKYQIAIVHGNGPQVGLLSLQNESFQEESNFPLNNLVAQTQGMIATVLTQELRKIVSEPILSFLTHVEVKQNDFAFLEPTKFIGAVYSRQEGNKLASKYGWKLKQDGQYYRRVVASPQPMSIIEHQAIELALQNGYLVICCGGGGIPVTKQEGSLTNIDCVIDKDSTAALLAQQIQADYFIILTDGDGIYLNWGKENQQKLDHITIEELSNYKFDKGSMQPKVDAIIRYLSHRKQGIGIIADLHLALEAIKGQAGTRITAR